MSKKISPQASTDNTTFQQYVAAAYYAETLDEEMEAGGAIHHAAEKLMKKETRKGVVQVGKFRIHLKILKPRVRRLRKDSNTTGKRKAYVMKKKLAERARLMMRPIWAGRSTEGSAILLLIAVVLVVRAIVVVMFGSGLPR